MARKTASFSSTVFDGPDAANAGLGYEHGQPIFSQGESATAIFRLQSGNVKLSVKRGSSRSTVIAVLKAGEVFGEDCLLLDSVYRVTATSIQQASILRIGRRVMLARLKNPAATALLLDHLMRRLGGLEENLVDQLVNSSQKRLARLLLHLSAPEGAGRKRSQAVLHVDQATLAQVVGTTRSRVSYFMNKFRNDGFIEYNGSLQVNDSLASFLLP